VDDGERLRVALLGVFRVSRGDVDLPVPGTRLRDLAARLALAGGRTVQPDVLVDAVWTEDPPAGPAHALQTLVSRLRRMLGSANDVTRVAGGYRLDVDAADVDALRFERLAAAGRDHLRTGDPTTAAAVLDEAVALWGEHPGVEPAVVAAVAPAAATRLAHASVEAVADLADAELAVGRPDTAATRLTALLADHPLHERAAALLMDALAAQGRQADALALYERVRETLADVLGTDPGTALRERHLGLLRAETPTPVRTRPNTLPVPLTSFIGRDDDLARIEALLAAGRLVTVLGPGGAGKTRLAVEAARRHECRDGVWMVDLAPVTEPAKVGAAVLAAIGPRGGALVEARGRGDELDALVDRLDGRECLLLVDNCEHLVDAAARLVSELLSRCSGPQVLATSREPLAIDGEALAPLGPLPMPRPDDDVDRAQVVASVRLFTERAAAVRPGFAVDGSTLSDVVRVVRGLDGLPLALELAAARLRTLSLPELADGLSDRFRLLTTGSRTALPRHRTLRAVIAWSWDLLGEHERTVAERVSILSGGVTPASAAAVCEGTPVRTADVPDLLAGLVDRSLVQLAPDPGRYRVLETIREYGIERLAESGDLGTTLDLAADHVTELMARLDRELRGPGQVAALRVVNAEYDNAVAALRHRCDTGDASGAVALALSLTWYWRMLGRQSDAVHWLGAALAVPGGEPTPERDRASAIHLLAEAGPVPTAGADHRERRRELADRLLAHPEPLDLPGLIAARVHDDATWLALVGRVADGDDRWLAGLARLFRAQYVENAGELAKTRTDVEEALACFRQVGDSWGQADALQLRAQLRQYDDLDGSLADLREARSLADRFGSLGLGDEVYSDLRWIDLHLRRGDTDLAVAMIDSARDRADRAASEEMLVLVDVREADFRVRLGDLDRARELLDHAERGPHGGLELSGDHVRTLAGTVRAALSLELDDPVGAAEALAAAYAAAVRTEDRPILSLVAVTTAALAETLGRHQEAAFLLGASSRLLGAHDRTDPRVLDLTRRGRTALGENAFAEAYEKGHALDVVTAAAEVDPARLNR